MRETLIEKYFTFIPTVLIRFITKLHHLQFFDTIFESNFLILSTAMKVHIEKCFIAIFYVIIFLWSSSVTCVPETRCYLKQEVGPCRGLIERFWFNPNTRRCEEFFFGGCGGNRNNFRTLEACTASCVD